MLEYWFRVATPCPLAAELLMSCPPCATLPAFLLGLGALPTATPTTGQPPFLSPAAARTWRLRAAPAPCWPPRSASGCRSGGSSSSCSQPWTCLRAHQLTSHASSSSSRGPDSTQWTARLFLTTWRRRLRTPRKKPHPADTGACARLYQQHRQLPSLHAPMYELKRLTASPLCAEALTSGTPFRAHPVPSPTNYASLSGPILLPLCPHLSHLALPLRHALHCPQNASTAFDLHACSRFVLYCLPPGLDTRRSAPAPLSGLRLLLRRCAFVNPL